MSVKRPVDKLMVQLIKWRIIAAAVVGLLALVFNLGPLVAVFAALCVYLALELIAREQAARSIQTHQQALIADLNAFRDEAHVLGDELELAQNRASELAADLDEEHRSNQVLADEVRSLNQRMNVLNDRLMILNKELDKLGRTKGEFMARMSHELRTPLNAIVGYTELVLDGMYGDLTQKQYNRLDRVLRNGRDLLGLINDILDLSELESGHLDLNITSVNVENAMRLSVASIERQAEEKGLDFSLNIEDDIPPLRVDELRLRQMVVNLLDNAVKFTEAGEVSVSAAFLHIDDDYPPEFPRLRAGNWLVLKVSDTGIGIPEELHEDIFSDFVQADISATRSYGGSGLGLTITRRLAEMHGGTIWLASAPGQGTTFSLALPYDMLDESSATITMNLKGSADSQQPLILIVDDEEDAREILSSYLHQVGYRTIHAETGTRALNLAGQFYPDIILLDLLMPDLDGWEVLERLHAKPHTAGIAVITVSIMDQKRRAVKRGAVAHISKPINRDHLLKTVDMAMGFRAKPPILVVDNDDAARNTFTAVIRMAGHQAMPIKSAEAAINWLQQRHAGMVLLGFDDAVEARRQVLDFMHQHPESRGIPALVIVDDNADTQSEDWADHPIEVMRRRGLVQDVLLESINRIMADYEA